MKCPACKQEITQPLREGRCPMCEAPVARTSEQVRTLYVICGAMFLSIFAYAALVVLFEKTGTGGPEGRSLSGAAAKLVPSILLAAAGLEYIVALAAERVILARGTGASVRQAAIILGAASEAITILGLALYFMGCGVQWFTIFLGASAVSFLYLGTRLPVYARMLEGYAVRDGGG
jgi:hypothetical protein